MCSKTMDMPVRGHPTAESSVRLTKRISESASAQDDPKRVGYSLRLKKVKASRCEYGVRTFLRKSGGEGICSI